MVKSTCISTSTSSLFQPGKRIHSFIHSFIDILNFLIQVELATRLSDSSTLLAESQLEVTSLKTREAELRQQLDKLVTMDTQSRDELSSLKLQLTGKSAVVSPIIQNIYA